MTGKPHSEGVYHKREADFIDIDSEDRPHVIYNVMDSDELLNP